MFHRILSLSAVAGLAVVAACAKAPEPTPIYPEPVFDKYGNAISTSCTEDGILVDANGRPIDGAECCVAGYTYSANTGECLPPPDRGDKDRDPQRDPQYPDPQ